MEDDELLLVASSLLISALIKKGRKKTRRKRNTWVKKWLAKRDSRGVYNNLLQEMRLDDVDGYRRYLRMSTDTFEVCYV